MKLFFNVAIALGTTVISTPAFAVVQKFESDFEQNTPASEINGKSGWFFTRGAGLDYGKGFSLRGRGNAWVRNTTGWNAINRWINMSRFSEGDNCVASAWLRTSDNLTDGYMSVRDGSKSDGTGKILNEIKLVGPRTGGRGNISGYRQETFNFKMGSSNRLLFYVGLWGKGKDAWIQIDDVTVACGRKG